MRSMYRRRCFHCGKCDFSLHFCASVIDCDVMAYTQIQSQQKNSKQTISFNHPLQLLL